MKITDKPKFFPGHPLLLLHSDDSSLRAPLCPLCWTQLCLPYLCSHLGRRTKTSNLVSSILGHKHSFLIAALTDKNFFCYISDKFLRPTDPAFGVSRSTTPFSGSNLHFQSTCDIFFRKVNQIMMASCCAPFVETCGNHYE